MFRIRSIMNESRDKVCVHDIKEDSYDNNYYTIVTGDNASGKSSLLSKAVNHFLFGRKNDGFIESAIDLVYFSENNPSKIIALCNSKFDRFTSNPIFNKKINQRETTLTSMFYIHPEMSDHSRRGIAGIVDKCLKNSLRHKYIRDTFESNSVSEAFSMFGLQPDLHLKCNLDTKNIKYILDVFREYINGVDIFSDRKANSFFMKKHPDEEYLNNRNTILDESIQIVLKKMDCDYDIHVIFDTLLMLDAGKFTIRDFGDIYFSVSERRLYSDSKSLILEFNEIDIIHCLFILDIINVSDIQVIHLGSNKKVSIVSLSSGQRTLFGHAIVLSSFVEKNCMICIDEPENSLHPEWQLNFMRFISLLCPDSLEAHIFIATHSPQIISGMQFDNGCVLSLANRDDIDSIVIRKEHKYDYGNFNELQPLRIYREQSADKQLTGIFKSPGHKNDFIIRKLLLILSKCARKIRLTKDDNEFINEINILIEKNRIPEGDPVQLLLKQVLSFQKAGVSND